jgi:hypothetical protein
MKTLVTVVAVAVALAGCGGSGDDADSAGKEAKCAEAKAEVQKAADGSAQALEIIDKPSTNSTEREKARALLRILLSRKANLMIGSPDCFTLTEVADARGVLAELNKPNVTVEDNRSDVCDYAISC